MGKVVTFDIEANNLLNGESIDYTASPYVLKPSFNVHCIVVEEHETGDIIAFYDGDKYIFDGRRHEETDGEFVYVLEDYTPLEYEQRPLSEFPAYIKSGRIERIIGHNIINYDLLVCKLWYEDMHYTVDPIDTLGGVNIDIVDTMVLSKVLNPDRFGGHSLEKLAKSAGGTLKLDFRKHIPKDKRFKTNAADLVYYCVYDNKATTAVYKYLEAERNGLNLSKPIATEKATAEIITRQEHRGFHFDLELAEKSIKELDALMAERRERVQPYLPIRKATKKFLQEHTPPASQLKINSVFPPKRQFKKNGDPSAALLKFVDKVGGEYKDDVVIIDGERYTTPIDVELEFVLSKTATDDLLKFVAKHEAELAEDLSSMIVFGKKYPLPMQRTPLKTEREGDIEDSTSVKQWIVSLGWVPTEWKDKDLTMNSNKAKGRRTDEQIESAVERYVEETLNSEFCDGRLEILQANHKNVKRKLMRQALRRSCKVPTSPSFTIGQEKEVDPALEVVGKAFPYIKDVIEYQTFKHRRNSILGGGVDWEDVDEDAEKGYIANVREDGRIATPADTCGAATSRMKHKKVANIPRVTSLYGENMRGLFGVSKGFVQSGYDFDSLEAKVEGHYCVPMDTKALTRRGWKDYWYLKEGDEILGYNPETCLKEWTKVVGKVFYPKSKTYTLEAEGQKFRATGDHRWFVDQVRTHKKGYDAQVRTTKELNTGSRIIVNAPFNQRQDLLNSDNNLIRGKYGHDWVQRVLEMSHSERVCFLEGFMIADGRRRENPRNSCWTWAQNDGEYFEAALVASYLVNSGAITISDGQGNSRLKVATLCNNKRVTGQRMRKQYYGEEATWCPQTELGSWVMRQGNCITITGNCWRYDETKEYCNSLTQSKPNDVHSVLSRKITGIIDRQFDRAPAKSVKYGCTYGSQPAKVAKTLGSDLETGQVIFNAFWEAAAPLKKLKDALTNYWNTVGERKFILGLDGRRVPTRAEHALLNSLFQSAGVICAKQTMIFHDRLLKERGLSVDFFKDDWKKKNYMQQMIAYHK